jgi:hypothetical protein
MAESLNGANSNTGRVVIFLFGLFCPWDTQTCSSNLPLALSLSARSQYINPHNAIYFSWRVHLSRGHFLSSLPTVHIFPFYRVQEPNIHKAHSHHPHRTRCTNILLISSRDYSTRGGQTRSSELWSDAKGRGYLGAHDSTLLTQSHIHHSQEINGPFHMHSSIAPRRSITQGADGKRGAKRGAFLDKALS